MNQLLERKLNDLLLEAPQRARVFEHFKIDYCCGKQLSLGEACQHVHADPAMVLAALEAAASVEANPFISLRLGALADEIVARHHIKARTQGPRILQLFNKVCGVHGEKEPRLFEMEVIFCELHQDLLQHMHKEEAVLFPFCKELELATGAVSMHCGSVANPIRMMEYEHREALVQVAALEELSGHFVPPAGACNSWRVLYHELQAYVEDLHVHMQVENNLLFPAALRREEDLNEI